MVRQGQVGQLWCGPAARDAVWLGSARYGVVRRSGYGLARFGREWQRRVRYGWARRSWKGWVRLRILAKAWYG
jgi:hypothetical protein